MTARQAASKCGLPLSTFLRWCQQGRILGATKTEAGYHIPKSFQILFPYPKETMRRAVGE